jgi:TRAP-type C4-dicarboxylate transport system permease small subunit
MRESGVMSVVMTASRAAVGTAFAVLSAAVIIQVLGRTVLDSSPVWTEELTRFALLYMAAFGTGLSYRTGDLVNVDIVCEALPGRWPWFLRLISATLTAALAGALVYAAWRFTTIGVMQTSPALGWRMDFVHASILVLLLSLLLFSLLRVVRMLRGTSDGKPLASEEI